MSRIVYLNGQFMAEEDAKLSIFDRGLLFADAVYEGFGILDAQIIDFEMHFARLQRSLGEIDLPSPFEKDALFHCLMQLIEKNAIDEGFLYLHVTRGTADRDYVYSADLEPNIFAFTQPQSHQPADAEPAAVKMKSTPDIRWARRDIKSTNLLGQVMAKKIAHDAGAYEALMVEPDGHVTEGGATSFFIIKDGAIVARPVSSDILHGITRQSMLRVAEAEGLKIEHRRMTLEEAYEADEAFITGSSTYVDPVGEIDGHAIGDGKPGEITLRLRREYFTAVRNAFYTPA